MQCWASTTLVWHRDSQVFDCLAGTTERSGLGARQALTLAYPYFLGGSLDDLLHDVYEDLLAHGRTTNPTKGRALERIGVLLELANPRARLSRTETRGRLFSGLGELVWYLGGRSDAASIRYYISDYPGSDETGHMPGAYGPRLFGGGAESQMSRVLAVLAAKTDSRQCVVQLFSRKDLETGQEDVPCTCTIQFLAREGTLDVVVSMRSNDAYFGLTHDVFCFTMLQEIVASELSLNLGTYKHFVGSLHLYDRHAARARQFLQEGWQESTEMPAMPSRALDALRSVLEAEMSIRAGRRVEDARILAMEPYWADIVRLLLVFFHTKQHDEEAATLAARGITAAVYRPFIEARIARF